MRLKELIKLTSKHTFIFSIGDLAQKAVGFLLLPIYMRRLSPDDYGVLTMLGIIAMAFESLILQGMPTSAFRAYSFDYSYDKEQQKDAIYTAYAYLLLISLISYTLLILTSHFWSGLLFKEGDFTNFVRIIFLTNFFDCSSIIPFVVLRARLLSAWMAGITLGRVVIATVLTIWFVVFMDLGVLGVLLANLVVSAIVFSLSPIMLILTHRGFMLHISWDKLRGMLAFGWPIVPGIFAGWVLSATDRWFLEHFSTRTEVGLYSIGFKLSSILTIAFIGPFRKAWPAIFFPKAKEGDAQEVFARFITYFLLAGMVGSLAIMCASDHLIKIMGPREYWGAYVAIPILVIGLLLSGFQATINIGMYIENKMLYAPIVVISAAVSNIIFNALLVPRFGMMGAATGTSLAYAFQLGLTHFINQKIYPMPLDYRRLMHMALIFILIVALNYLITIPSFWLSLPVKASLFFSYIILLFVTGFFSPQEIEFIKVLFNRFSLVFIRRTS
jgi:O-antigen/teichoic acid export membrane protein